MASCECCASIILAHNNTCFTAIISVVWSLIPFVNCSFSLLSSSLYLHSVPLTLSLPIYSSAYSSDCFVSLQYCSDNIISLHCDLNLSPSVSNSPHTVSHASCSANVRIFTYCNPSLSSNFLMWVPFLHCLCQNVLVQKIFTTITKFLSSTYLSFTVQLKTGQ